MKIPVFIARTAEKERKVREFLEYCYLTDKGTFQSTYKSKNGKRLYLFPGDKIHLKNKGGTYTVKSVWGKNTVIITCHKWKAEKRSGLRCSDTLSIPIEMINCKQGGFSIYKEYK